MTDDEVQTAALQLVVRSRSEQGLPRRVEDTDVLATIAELMEATP